MHHRGIPIVLSFAFLLLPASVRAQGTPDAGPVSVEPAASISEGATVAAAGAPPVEPVDPPRVITELPNETPIENALSPESATMFRTIGGYGEITLNMLQHSAPVLDLRRFVVYYGHHFTDSLRFYGEVTVEHSLTAPGSKGTVEVQQAYVDALLWRKLNIRVGVVLMPMGIVNVYHEPPTYNGVERPDVDSYIHPRDWSEPSIGIFGELAPGLRYQVAGVLGLNASQFAARGLDLADQDASFVNASDAGGIARLDWEPVRGTVVGVSGYAATSANTLRAEVGGRVPVGITEIDARTRLGGFTARAELAGQFIGDTAALNVALSKGTDDEKAAGPVSAQSYGGYVEAGYNVLHVLARGSEQQLTAFGRFDVLDTQAHVLGGFAARPEFRRYTTTFGLTYRPIPQLAFKLDYRRHEFGAGPGLNEALSAVAWMF